MNNFNLRNPIAVKSMTHILNMLPNEDLENFKRVNKSSKKIVARFRIIQEMQKVEKECISSKLLWCQKQTEIDDTKKTCFGWIASKLIFKNNYLSLITKIFSLLFPPIGKEITKRLQIKQLRKTVESNYKKKKDLEFDLKKLDLQKIPAISTL